MVDFITVRDSLLTPIKFVTPLDFSASIGKKSNSGNQMQFKLPLSEGLLNIGDAVTYADTIYGGVIDKIDIDVKDKTATYYGKSFWGVLDNYIGVFKTTSDGQYWLATRSGDAIQRATTFGSYYPNGGIFPYMHWLFNYKFGSSYPFWMQVRITDVIPVSSGSLEWTAFNPGDTIADVVDKHMHTYLGNFNYKAVLTLETDLADTVSPKIWIDWKQGRTVVRDITDRADGVIITKSAIPTAMFDSYYIYSVDNGNIVSTYLNPSAGDAAVIQFPTDVMGVAQKTTWSEWAEGSSVDSQKALFAQKRAETISGITTNMSLCLNTGDTDIADVGDYVQLIERENAIDITQQVLEKTFKLSNGIATIDYKLG